LREHDDERKGICAHPDVRRQPVDDLQPVVVSAGAGTVEVEDHRPLDVGAVLGRQKNHVLVLALLIAVDLLMKTLSQLVGRRREPERSQQQGRQDCVFQSRLKIEPEET